MRKCRRLIPCVQGLETRSMADGSTIVTDDRPALPMDDPKPTPVQTPLPPPTDPFEGIDPLQESLYKENTFDPNNPYVPVAGPVDPFQ